MPVFDVKQKLTASILVIADNEADAKRISNEISFDDWEINPDSDCLRIEDVSDICDEDEAFNAPAEAQP
jgi:hypothetical protein